MMRKFRHPDGGTFVREPAFRLSMKMDDGRWEPAVMFRRVSRDKHGRWTYEGPNSFVIPQAKWDEKFTEITDEQD
jgi:hypothetical protein